MDAFYKLREYSSKILIQVVREKVELKLTTMVTLMENKVFNHKATAFMNIK